MSIEDRLTGIADQLDHEEVDLEEPISDAGHTVGQGLAATMREGAAEIARLCAVLEEAIGALGDAASLLTIPEHAWEAEDYQMQSRVNDVYSRLAARAEGRES